MNLLLKFPWLGYFSNWQLIHLSPFFPLSYLSAICSQNNLSKGNFTKLQEKKMPRSLAKETLHGLTISTCLQHLNPFLFHVLFSRLSDCPIYKSVIVTLHCISTISWAFYSFQLAPIPANKQINKQTKILWSPSEWWQNLFIFLCSVWHSQCGFVQALESDRLQF